jgi:nucleoside-diphosphate-sugar epimerase
MSAPTYSAALTFQVPIGTEYFRGRPCYRVIADVTAVTGFTDDRLFVHRRIAPPNSAAIDEFIGVAGPVDIVDFTDTPDANGYFRKNRVDMLLESHYLYDAVVNTVGVLRDTRARPIDAVHQHTPIALFDACVQAGVRRVVHVSALGIVGSSTRYARTKLAADEHLLGLRQRHGDSEQTTAMTGVYHNLLRMWADT